MYFDSSKAEDYVSGDEGFISTLPKFLGFGGKPFCFFNEGCPLDVQ